MIIPIYESKSDINGSFNEEYACQICLNYHNMLRRPLVLNPYSHTICSECIKSLETQKCPYDQRSIVSTKPNVEIETILNRPVKKFKIILSKTLSTFAMFTKYLMIMEKVT
jgi:hypothetical protein